MQALFARARRLEALSSTQRRIILEKMEDRVLFDGALLALDLGDPIPVGQGFAFQEAEIAAETPAVSSDPLGLTSSNQDNEDAPRVFIVDGSNPNAISDTTGINRTDVTAETPLSNLDALRDRSFLRDGDQIFIRGGEYILSNPIRVDANNVLFAAYGEETPIIRYGSFVYHWAMQVRGNGFTMDGIDMVGHIETEAGRLYSHLMLVIRGDDATIQNSTFRHNSNYLPVEQGGDIAFGKRVLANGQPLTDAQQLWGRLVSFIGSQGSQFLDNVVVALEAQTIESWERGRTYIEGLMLEKQSEVLIERNQFGSAGHQMINSTQSTAIIRHNSFGDVSDYEHLLPFRLSDHVRVPATHTAVGLGVNDGSEFSNNLLVYNRAHPDDTGNGVQIQGSTNSEVFNNLFVDAAGIGHGIHLGFNTNSSVEVESAYNRIYNNTFVNVPTPLNVGYFTGGAPVGGTAIHDNEVFNNLVVISDAVKQSPYSVSNVPLTTILGDPESGNGNVFYNNLLFDVDGNIVFKSRTPNGVVPYTIDEMNSLSYAHGNLSADPMFVNLDEGDFRVQESSPAIIADPNIDQPATDFQGRTRPTEYVVIGAFGVQDVAQEPVYQIVAPDSFQGQQAVLTVTAEPPATTRTLTFHVDWNSDGRTDQIVHGPLGTELSHRYRVPGPWTVAVGVTENNGQLLASLRHDFTITTDPPSDPATDDSPDPTHESPTVVVKENSFVTIQLGESSANEIHTYELDWNGDGKMDQSITAPAGTIVDHFFRSPGEYSVQIQQRTIDSRQVIATRNVTVRVSDDERDEDFASQPVLVIVPFDQHLASD